ncbi:cytochrome c/c1 heme-lyase [Catenaria anguillulae PL171]|uniref:Holocytochrome c-type synthase n=1 Tax=Catenaria anguillulae PL171 TaxID=765915 RepID=A0A1Y2HH66_9FUNG|nr:cytochrome c/c1 heme-lyase [Catenaria anguillulae PL171]
MEAAAKCPIDHAAHASASASAATAAAPLPTGHPPSAASGAGPDSTSAASKCPVDHSKIDKSSHPFFHPPTTSPSSSPDESAAKCPVDHSKIDKASHPLYQTPSAAATPPSAPAPTSRPPSGPAGSHDSATLDLRNYLPYDLGHQPKHPDQAIDLPVERELSSIPRAGQDAKDGEVWVYPSQQMFFNAMKRKNWDAKETDMQVVVPIHNAVNEMAWKRILEWEAVANPQPECTPKLSRFQGRPGDLTPRAWFKSTFLGYTKPFDRHDWSVDRCGTSVNYVIDFYSGKLPAGAHQGPGAPVVSFYLDVRPKLDTLEGVKLRVQRFWSDLFN